MKEAVRPDLEEVFEFYGARILPGSGQWQKASCPLTIHEDNSPSASVNVEAGKWSCFSCDKRGDVYDILKENEGLVGFPDLVRFAEENFAAGSRDVREERPSRGGVSSASRGKRGNGNWVPAWRRL